MYKRGSGFTSCGSRDVWFGKGLGSPLEKHRIHHRLRPGYHFNDVADMFVFVNSTCLNMPTKATGCLAVLLLNRQWRPVLVFKINEAKLLYQNFDTSNKLLPKIHEQVISTQTKVDFHFVGMYNKEHVSGNSPFTALITINQNDLCLDCSPNSPTLLRSSTQRTSKKRKRGNRRGKRGTLRRINGRKLPVQDCVDIYYDVQHIHSLHMSAKKNKKTVLLPSTNAKEIQTKLHPLSLFERVFYEIPKNAAADIPLNNAEAILYLKQKSVAIHKQFEIHTKLTLRIIAVSTDEFNATKAKNGVLQCSNFLYNISRTPTVELRGVCVSCWKFDQPIELFTMNDMVLSANIYGKGHGDRRICANLGGNVYAAERRSTQQSPNPEHGRGLNLRFSRYTRMDWCNPERRAHLEAKLRNAGSQALGLFEDVFDNFLTFIGRKTGTLLIWTYGSADSGTRIVRKTGEGNKNPRYSLCYNWVLNFIGFANTPHVDGDSMKEADADRWMEGLLPDSTIHKYATRIWNMFGLGVQTTCGYNIATSSNAHQSHLLSHLHAYFCLGQFAVPIKHCSAHLFFGWAIPHCTAVPLVHENGKYHVNNDDLEGSIVIGAWGVCNNGGGQYTDPNILIADGRGDANFHPDQLQNHPDEHDQQAPHQYNINNDDDFVDNFVTEEEVEQLTQERDEFNGTDNPRHYDNRANRRAG